MEERGAEEYFQVPICRLSEASMLTKSKRNQHQKQGRADTEKWYEAFGNPSRVL
jgi:hypothetical protein